LTRLIYKFVAEILDVAKAVKETVVTGTTEILNATKDVKDTLVELHTQVVQALRKLTCFGSQEIS
jgi:hypothetical protein